MILNQQQIDALTNEGTYQCSLIKRRFAHLFFKDDISPFGNIVAFECKTDVGPLHIENALNVCVELPNTSMFGGVCFQRLYAAQLGTVLSALLNKSCYVSESCVFVENLQSTLSIVNKIKDSVVFHIIFPIQTNKKEFFELSLTNEDLHNFKLTVVDCFHQLAKSVFLETQRDNF